MNSCYVDYCLPFSARSLFGVKSEFWNALFFLLKMFFEHVGHRVTVVILGMNAVDPANVTHVRFCPVVHEQSSLVRSQVRRHDFAQGVQQQRTKNVVTHDDRFGEFPFNEGVVKMVGDVIISQVIWYDLLVVAVEDPDGRLKFCHCC